MRGRCMNRCIHNARAHAAKYVRPTADVVTHSWANTHTHVCIRTHRCSCAHVGTAQCILNLCFAVMLMQVPARTHSTSREHARLANHMQINNQRRAHMLINSNRNLDGYPSVVWIYIYIYLYICI